MIKIVDTLKQLAWQPFSLLPVIVRRKVQYFIAHRKLPDFRNPSSFNEKVNWRIINDRRDELSWTCDKIAMKHNVAALAPSLKIPITLWKGTSVSDLSDFKFPDRWILKASHRSQCVYVGKGHPDLDVLEKVTRGWMSSLQSARLGEWAYSKAQPAIFLEEWIGDDDNPPFDFKFFVFKGRVVMIQVDEDRFSGHRMSLYDDNWNRLTANKTKAAPGRLIEKPENLDQMIYSAEKIGSSFDFMRVDLFDTCNGVYFGETTPYPGGGLSPFSPESFDEWLGSFWSLPAISKPSILSA